MSTKNTATVSNDNIEQEKIKQLERNENKQLIAARFSQEFSGPIPHPELFAKYEDVLPGSADRILKMAELQSEHRQYLEKSVIDSNIQDSKRGQYFAFILALVLIIGGFYLIANDKDAYGISLIIGSAATLVGIFIYGRKSERKEREEKRECQ